MSKISEERLQRAAFAIERGLLTDIQLTDGEYDVYHDGDHVTTCSTLSEALEAWDAAENGLLTAPKDETEDFSVDYDQDGNYREDMMPTWEGYEFDEDGYKRRRT